MRKESQSEEGWENEKRINEASEHLEKFFDEAKNRTLTMMMMKRPEVSRESLDYQRHGIP
jgi:hypothetical protein